MGRPKRADAAGHCYHMLNRANLRAKIFEKDADYEAFEKIIDEALERFKMVPTDGTTHLLFDSKRHFDRIFVLVCGKMSWEWGYGTGFESRAVQ